MRLHSSKRAAALLLASTMLSAGTAHAQDAATPAEHDRGNGQTATTTAEAATETVEGDIIVTAQKRSENLQDVPISIQALGTERLEQLNVASFTDYTKLAPSVSFQTAQSGSPNVYIRGVASGGDGNHSGSLPSVGVYLDEQPVTTIGGMLDVHIYDIARIEVLRGPQGTLYGASSEAGTIRIITNKPDPSGFYGGVDAEANAVRKGGIGGQLEGFVNMPLGERAALRMVGWYRHDAGYIDNVQGSRTFLPNADGDQITVDNADLVEKDFNEVDVIGGRAALGIDLDDNWTATASVIAQQTKADGVFGFDPSVGDLQVQHFFDEYRNDRFLQAALTVEGKVGNWDLTYAGAYLTRKAQTSNDYTDYAEAYDALYEGVGGLAGYFYFNDDAGNLINPSQHIIGRDRYRKMSHELRLASPADAPLRFVGGLFYQRQTHGIFQDYQVTGLADELSVNGYPGTLWLTLQNRKDKDYAAFGEVSYDVTPTFTLTGGLRAYRYDNSLIGFFGFGRNPGGNYTDGPFNAAGSSRTGFIQCLTSTGVPLRDNPGGTILPGVVDGTPCTNLGVFENGKVRPKSTSGEGFTHRLNATWKVTPDHLLYATWSKGFRPGGINRRAGILPYDEDTLTNYELGFKTSFGRLRFNGAFFWQDWKKFQFSFLGLNSFTEIHNGPDARIKGIELDASWRSVSGLALNASAAYTQAKTRRNLCGYDDPSFTCTAPGPDGEDNFISAPSGTRLPVTPKLKFAATARQEFPLWGGKGHVQAVLAHQSSASSDIRTLIYGPGGAVNPAVGTGRLPAQTSADFALGVDMTRWTAEIFIENAFDERGQLGRFQQCGQCFQRPYVLASQPRTIGIRAGTRF
jgi:outer membrane receptor protein involved in Fe transport